MMRPGRLRLGSGKFVKEAHVPALTGMPYRRNLIPRHRGKPKPAGRPCPELRDLPAAARAPCATERARSHSRLVTDRDIRRYLKRIFGVSTV